MTLAKRINDQLQSTSPDQSVDIRGTDEKLRVEVKLADCGRLGCLLDGLQLEHTEDGHLAVDPVQIAKKINYLEERLEIIETEGKAGRTILRSAPPRREDQSTSFFEMVLDRSTRLSLARYKYDPRTRKRTSVPAPLSRDTLERLIGDLIGLASGNQTRGC